MPPDEFLLAVGQRFKQARLLADLSQKAAAKAAGVSPAYVYLLENGQQNISLLVFRRMAEAVRANMSDLFVGTDHWSGPSEESLAHLTELVKMLVESLAARQKQSVEMLEKMLSARRDEDTSYAYELEQLRVVYEKAVELLGEGKTKGRTRK